MVKMIEKVEGTYRNTQEGYKKTWIPLVFVNLFIFTLSVCMYFIYSHILNGTLVDWNGSSIVYFISVICVLFLIIGEIGYGRVIETRTGNFIFAVGLTIQAVGWILFIYHESIPFAEYEDYLLLQQFLWYVSLFIIWVSVMYYDLEHIFWRYQKWLWRVIITIGILAILCILGIIYYDRVYTSSGLIIGGLEITNLEILRNLAIALGLGIAGPLIMGYIVYRNNKWNLMRYIFKGPEHARGGEGFWDWA